MTRSDDALFQTPQSLACELPRYEAKRLKHWLTAIALVGDGSPAHGMYEIKTSDYLGRQSIARNADASPPPHALPLFAGDH